MDITSLTPNKQVKLQYWLHAIHECRSSGLTNQAWCEQNGISLKNYYYWIAKIRKLAIEDLPRKQYGDSQTLPCKPEPAETKDSVFEEVHLPVSTKVPPTGSPDAVIHVKDISLEVFEHTSDPLLRRLMKAVQEC